MNIGGKSDSTLFSVSNLFPFKVYADMYNKGLQKWLMSCESDMKCLINRIIIKCVGGFFDFSCIELNSKDYIIHQKMC